MNLRELILHADMTRGQLVKYIMTMSCPDPDEIDQWAMGLFEADPDDECLIRRFVVFGPLKDCADAVAGCLTRKHPDCSRMRILSFQGKVPEIDCRENDFCF
jgi:hypothetical protein